MRLGGSGGGVVPSGGGAKERVQKVSHITGLLDYWITTKQTQQSPEVKVQDQCSKDYLSCHRKRLILVA